MAVFCGIDWAEDHYDVALIDQVGVVRAQRRIDDDALGYQVLLERWRSMAMTRPR